MARNEMFVTVYRLEVEAVRENSDSMESFIEVISDNAVVSGDEGRAAVIIASSDALGITESADTAFRFFGKEGYNISTLGFLGPFKKKSIDIF